MESSKTYYELWISSQVHAKNMFNKMSALVQVMAWYHHDQATSRYQSARTNVDPELCHFMASLGHNELISSICGITRSKWVNIFQLWNQKERLRRNWWMGMMSSTRRRRQHLCLENTVPVPAATISGRSRRCASMPLHQHPCWSMDQKMWLASVEPWLGKCFR